MKRRSMHLLFGVLALGCAGFAAWQGVRLGQARALYTYAAIQAWVKAATDAKSTDADKVVPELNKETFQTVLGPIKFDKKGDPTEAAYVWYVWKDGKYSKLAQ